MTENFAAPFHENLACFPDFFFCSVLLVILDRFEQPTGSKAKTRQHLTPWVHAAVRTMLVEALFAIHMWHASLCLHSIAMMLVQPAIARPEASKPSQPITHHALPLLAHLERRASQNGKCSRPLATPHFAQRITSSRLKTEQLSNYPQVSQLHIENTPQVLLFFLIHTLCLARPPNLHVGIVF